MFSLMSGLISQYFQKKEIKVLMLGVDHSGKTTLLERIKFLHKQNKEEGAETRLQLQMHKITSTVGLNIARFEVKNTKVIVWDLGGANSLRSIWDKYYPDCHGLIWVIDSAQPERFAEGRGTLEAVLRQPDMQDVPVLVLANKCDLSGSIPLEHIREHVLPLESDVLRDRQVRVLAISAMDGKGVAEAIHPFLEWIARNPRQTEGS
mmetsp:Transcript_17859/g.27605  ORF Transcript_17859/g.27605 Transcript_17859/m.27605 type:complete len:206 (+) Transcript_17859:60-677(+)|eukprot:CAMPEP_0184293864 /NCGR_PEP_ID=MMETSP1049-20130417/5189_1 /TAXON_ID=77928 /ORGANISM="Proteomonas sulcata, Strain CCMP704" /LENGTH=205 /DNA_ID=CAMNT_0026601957 /DNA_START=45 /DNA_END=662 /DNA_ORIENTATION=-